MKGSDTDMMKRIAAGMLALALTASSFTAITGSAEDLLFESPTAAVEKKADDAILELEDDITAPNTPEVVSAVRKNGKITITWKKVAGCAGYIVTRKHPLGEEYGSDYEYLSGDNTVTYTFQTDKDKDNSWNYYVSAFVYDSIGARLCSAPAKFGAIVDEDNTVLGKANIKNTSSTANSIKFSWDAISCDGFEVEIKTTGNWKKVGSISGDNTTLTINKAKTGTTYYVRMRAYKKNAAGETVLGDYSNEAAITTSGQTVKAPEKTKFNKVVKSNTSFKAYWDAVSCDGYQIYINKTGNSNEWQFVANVSSSTTEYEFKDLKPSTNYWVTLCAFNRDSNNNPVYGPWTTNIKVTTTEKANDTTTTIGAPSVVTWTTATRTYDAIRVNWNKVSCDGYEIYLNKTGNSSDWKHIADVAADVTTYRITGLKENTNHWVAIRAFKKNSSGQKAVFGPYSSNVKVQTTSKASTAKKPGATNFTKASMTYDAIRLTWTQIPCDGYFLYQWKDNKWTRVAAIKGNTKNTHRVTKLNAGTKYFFMVRAFNFTTSGGKVYGPNSKAVSVTTKKK